MDSNNSKYYENDYFKDKPTLSQVISDHSFKNLVPSKGYECFKLRHAQGDQPSKFGQLMFDSIDKILVPQNYLGNEIKFDLFQKYPIEYWPILYNWRTNEEIRSLFSKYCSNINNIKGKSEYVPKQIGKLLIDNNPQNRWNSSVNSIEYQLLFQEISKVNEKGSLTHQNKLDHTTDIQAIFSFIYPNSNAPSDHPPLIFDIQFEN